MQDTPPGFDLLRLLERHRYHYRDEKACHFCRIDRQRRENTPEAVWSRSLMRTLRPPMPVAVMAFSIVALTVALAFSLTA